jgi:hypothetical protein
VWPSSLDHECPCSESRQVPGFLRSGSGMLPFCRSRFPGQQCRGRSAGSAAARMCQKGSFVASDLHRGEPDPIIRCASSCSNSFAETHRKNYVAGNMEEAEAAQELGICREIIKHVSVSRFADVQRHRNVGLLRAEIAREEQHTRRVLCVSHHARKLGVIKSENERLWQRGRPQDQGRPERLLTRRIRTTVSTDSPYWSRHCGR